MKGYLGGLLSGLSLCIVVALGLSRYHLTINVGQSLPGMLYACRPLTSKDRLGYGDIVYYLPPPHVAATLHRIAPGADVRLGWLKQIAATAGDEVCWEYEHIMVNQWRVGFLPLLQDYPLRVPHSTCHVLRHDEVLTMGHAARSFDGRYTGPMSRQEIRDVCQRLL